MNKSDYIKVNSKYILDISLLLRKQKQVSENRNCWGARRVILVSLADSEKFE